VGCAGGSQVLDAPVTIGITTDKPGVTYQDPVTGKRSGFDVSLYEWISTYSDHDFTPQVVDLTVRDREDELIRGGDAGGVDLVVASYTITSQRETEVDFAGPYLETRQGVMVRADDSRRITNPSELSGRSVCAQSGSTSVNELRQIPGAIVVESIGLLQCVRSLLAGQVDAVSTDAILLHGYARDDQALRIENGVIFGAIQQYGIGLPPEDGTASCELLNRHLQRFMDSGAWDTAFRTNFGDGRRPEEFRPSRLRECVADGDTPRPPGGG
jgi:glutamate transport system substrate-binding protein